ncbi:MAG: oxidoreductase [Crocinitomicaceae bacterium]|nr:oxidoreductase [Crocinitomicaceae bacterium]
MKLANNTVLVTGGSSGIGLELSKTLVEKGNTVIICGRSEAKLNAAQKAIPQLITYSCNLANANECAQLAQWVMHNYPTLNVLINNAAMVNRIDYLNDENALELAQLEYNTNLLAPIRLIRLLYPLLKANNSATIVNVTTGLVYAPKAEYPFYNSTKAGLHSFTQTLRMKIPKHINVHEVFFPVVDTPWHDGKPPKIAISAQEAVHKMLKGLQNNQTEIRIKGVKALYWISRIAPNFAIKLINRME